MEPALDQIIESIIFVSDQPVTVRFLHQVLTQQEASTKESEEEQEEQLTQGLTTKEIEAALQTLLTKYQDISYPFEIKKVSGGYQFYTKRAFYPFVRKAVVNKNKRKLTRSALETLSIVAYKQPITKAEVEFIRGVNCDYSIQKLLEKNLLSIIGRADAPGRPLLYSTSPFFMEYFGIADMTELPKLKEFEEMQEDKMGEFRQITQNQQNETTQGEEEAVLEGDEPGGEAAEAETTQSIQEAVSSDAGEAEQGQRSEGTDQG